MFQMTEEEKNDLILELLRLLREYARRYMGIQDEDDVIHFIDGYYEGVVIGSNSHSCDDLEYWADVVKNHIRRIRMRLNLLTEDARKERHWWRLETEE